MHNNLSNAASALGKKGGAIKSPAKAAAARENAKLAGRPKLHPAEKLARVIIRGAQGRVSHGDALKFAEEILRLDSDKK